MNDSLFDPWCTDEEIKAKTTTLRLLRSKPSSQAAAITTLHSIVPAHYCQPAVVNKWLKKWGYQKTLATVKKNLPAEKKSRSGDLGEILATEYTARKLGYTVPILRLRWRDHRELALRGDDLFALRFDAEGRIHFLKGESKSRQSLSADVVLEATGSLLAHDGRPSSHTINFIVNRLYELGEDGLADSIAEFISTRAIPRKRVTHLVFALCGNDPKPYLEKTLSGYKGTIQQIFVGLRVTDHADFVKTVFDGVQLA